MSKFSSPILLYKENFLNIFSVHDKLHSYGRGCRELQDRVPHIFVGVKAGFAIVV